MADVPRSAYDAAAAADDAMHHDRRAGGGSSGSSSRGRRGGGGSRGGVLVPGPGPVPDGFILYGTHTISDEFVAGNCQTYRVYYSYVETTVQFGRGFAATPGSSIGNNFPSDTFAFPH
jgi:hypothetical protein